MRTKMAGMHIPDILADPVYRMPCYEGPTKTSTTTISTTCPLPNAATDLFKKTTMALKMPNGDDKHHHLRSERETPLLLHPKEAPPAAAPPIPNPPQRRKEDDYEDQTFPIIPYLASVVSLVCIAFVAFWGELLQLRIRKEKNRQVMKSLEKALEMDII